MKKNSILFALLFESLFFWSCNNDQIRDESTVRIDLGSLIEETNNSDSSEIVYFNDSLNIELKYPRSWEVEEHPEQGGVFYAHDEYRTEFDVETNFSLKVMNVAEIPDLDSMLSFERKRLESNDYPIFNARIVSHRKIQYKKEPAVLYFGQGVYVKSKKEYNMKWKKILFIKQNLQFELSSSSTKEKFDRDSIVINRIFDSFVFVNED
jgi:hypothetical protein